MAAAIGGLVLRLAVATIFIAHGLHKLFGIGGGPGIGPGGLEQTAAQFATLGLSQPFLLAVLAGLTQLAAGVLLLAGYLTRWAALALIIYCAFGMWMDHGRWGFFLNWISTPGRGHGIEYSVVLIGALTFLVLAGGGEWSLDGRRAHHVAAAAAGRARLRRA
jgi:putative oxidoreductase